MEDLKKDLVEFLKYVEDIYVDRYGNLQASRDKTVGFENHSFDSIAEQYIREKKSLKK